MTRYTQEDTLSTYLDLGRNSAIIFIADRALGPPQVKCRLLISSIFDEMNFQHFLEKL